MNKIEISAMTPDKVKSVSEIEKICFSEPWSENALMSECENEQALFFVAEENGNVTGYIGMHTVLDECYIANIAVFPEYRRRGIGDSLLNFAEKKAAQSGCSFISLEVRVSNSGAIALYEKHGYEIQGQRKNFYRNPTEDALIMTKYFNEV